MAAAWGAPGLLFRRGHPPLHRVDVVVHGLAVLTRGAERAPPTGETMIGHHDQGGLFSHPLEGVADDTVELHVDIFDHVRPGTVDLFVVGRVLGIHGAPQHV